LYLVPNPTKNPMLSKANPLHPTRRPFHYQNQEKIEYVEFNLHY